MAGYCRQSDADIIPNEVIKAAPINKEFNCVKDAFNKDTGHKHDGTSFEGALVPLIADPDKKNYVCIDTSNNRVSFFTEVASNPVEQVRVQDGAIVPSTDDDIDLGVNTTNRFKDLYLAGNATVGGVLTTTGNTTFSGTLGVTGVATFSDTVCGTDFCSTGSSTLATVDINAGTIDNTIIGATTPSAGSFTTLSTTGQGTFATVDINGGTIDGAIIGGTTAGAITGTTITGTSLVGPVTGNVTGNVTGDVTGDLTGDVTGDLTGNVTGNVTGNLTGDVTGDITGAVTGNLTGNVTGDLTGDVTSTGTSTFVDINLSGSAGLDMGSAKITSIAEPTASSDVSSKGYVDTQITNLIGGAPGALDTLNELAEALNDDANAYSTLTTCIGTKLATAGGTMTGDITLGSNKITSTATPTTASTLTRKGYVDTQDALKLNLTGGTMSGAIAMGTSKITGLGNPTLAQDAATKTYTDSCVATSMPLSGGVFTGNVSTSCPIISTYAPVNNCDLTNKCYVDSILQSATAASTSATAAATSETNAATSETNAGNSATAAASSASSAASSYDAFDDRYLGDKVSEPTLDNDGDALLTGALYYDSTGNQLKVYTGSSWSAAAFTLGDALTAISEDTTPTLGGNLEANSQCITNAANVCANNFYGAFNGNVTGCVSSLNNFNASDVCFGSVCVSSNPTSACQLATKEYVDTIAAAGIHYHTPVRVEPPSNLAVTYDNGSSGVGATLTNSSTQAALVLDNVTMVAADRVLVANQTDQTQNGVYTVTDIGSASTNWVLTRSTDTDSAAPSDPDAFGKGDAFFITDGDTNAGHLDVLTTTGTIVFGTTNIVFAEVAETSVYDAGTGVVLTGSTFSIGQPVATTDDVTFSCVTSTSCVLTPILCASTCLRSECGYIPRICSSVQIVTPYLCAYTNIDTPCICAWCCTKSKVICGVCCLKSVVVCGSTTRGTTACFTDFNSTSDCRCKDNITTVENAYCKIGQIRGVNYNWKDSGKYTLGVVAQEVEEAFPELVTTDGDGFKAVNYNGIVGVLVETVKCLQSKVEELENGSKG